MKLHWAVLNKMKGDMKNRFGLTMALCLLVAHKELRAVNAAYMRIQSTEFGTQDTLVLEVWEHLVYDGYADSTPKEVYLASDENGFFSFDVPLQTAYAWISLGLNSERYNGTLVSFILEREVLVSGDSLFVEVGRHPNRWPTNMMFDSGKPWYRHAYVCSFSGRGSDRFALKRAADSLLGKDASTGKVAQVAGLQLPLGMDELMEKLSGQASEEIVGVMRSEILGEFYGSRIEEALALGGGDPLAVPGIERWKPREEEMASAPKFLTYLDRYHSAVLRSSGGGSAVSWLDMLAHLESRYQGLLLERMICRTIWTKTVHSASADELKAVLAYWTPRVGDRWSRLLLASLGTRAAGAEVYGFTLANEHGEEVSLSDFDGKIVVLDFYYAACGPCKAYFQATLKPVIHSFKRDTGVVFVSICTDGFETFCNLIKEGTHTSECAVNLYTRGLGFGHPIIRHFKITGYPTPVLIGRTGKVVAIGRELRTIEGLTSAIQRAQLGD